jgi:hypothetical protein
MLLQIYTKSTEPEYFPCISLNIHSIEMFQIKIVDLNGVSSQITRKLF